jgi:hypothetical protein
LHGSAIRILIGGEYDGLPMKWGVMNSLGMVKDGSLALHLSSWEAKLSLKKSREIYKHKNLGFNFNQKKVSAFLGSGFLDLPDSVQACPERVPCFFASHSSLPTLNFFLD